VQNYHLQQPPNTEDQPWLSQQKLLRPVKTSGSEGNSAMEHKLVGHNACLPLTLTISTLTITRGTYHRHHHYYGHHHCQAADSLMSWKVMLS
jgi:hypothetical protein